MKASKLIEELQKLISKHGDLNVLSSDNEYGNVLIADIKYVEIPCVYENEPPTFVIRSV